MSGVRPILIAEDDLRDIELIQESLESLNLINPMVVMRDGSEALDYLYGRGKYAATQPTKPILVLLDVKMPKVDGIQVLRQMKSDETLSRIPVVMLTSSREITDLEECYDLGVNAYVVKPMKFSEFVTALKQVGAFWAMVNEPPPLQGSRR